MSNGFAQMQTQKIIAIEEGNSNLRVNKLFKSANGTLWAATTQGLYKLLGHKPIKVTGNPENDNNITALAQDSSGVIWAGSKNGNIYFLKEKKLQASALQNFQPGNTINDMACSKTQMYIATAGAGIFEVDQNKAITVNTQSGLGDDYVNCLLLTNKGKLVAGTDRGVSVINLQGQKKSITTITTKHGLTDNIVKCLSPTNMPNIIMGGTQAEGAFLFDCNAVMPIKNSFTGFPKGQINDLLSVGRFIYLLYENTGVVKSNSLWKPIDTKIEARHIIADDEGNVWLANENNLIRFENYFFEFIGNSSPGEQQKITAVHAGKNNDIFFANGTNLFTHNSTTCSTHKIFQSPPNKGDITSIYEDNQGFVWIGTMSGILRLQPTSRQSRPLLENPELANASILCISGKGNTVWVSSLNGVARFLLNDHTTNLSSSLEYRNYSKADGIGSNYVYHTFTDAQNRTWLATDGAGATVFENNKFSQIDTALANKVVYSVAEDKSNNIWLNTYESGLFKFSRKRENNLKRLHFFSNTNYNAIAADNNSQLIMIAPASIDIVNTNSLSLRHYSAETGIPVQEGSLNAITKDKEGSIWIGTGGGLLRFSPDSTYSTAAPYVEIDELLLFNEDMKEHWKKDFSHNQNNLTFYYSAINYSMPERVTYEYSLEGYDTRWNQTKDQILVFPKLPPGKYNLKLRASATQYFDASPITTYSFVIDKPFWLKWWFLLVVGLLLIGAIYVLIKWRSNRARAKEQAEKERFQLQYDILKTQVNPHFLFNSFNALLNVIEDDPNGASEMTLHLSTFYRKMTAYRNKDLITISEELELLHSYIFIQQKRFGNALELVVDLPEQVANKTFIPPFVLQLLAENAVKHNAISIQQPLKISVYHEGESIIVENNVVAKLVKEDGEGLGLQNIRDRYKAFSNNGVLYGIQENKFVVKLPVIKISGN